MMNGEYVNFLRCFYNCFIEQERALARLKYRFDSLALAKI